MGESTKQFPKRYKEDCWEDPLKLYFEDLDSTKLLTRREEVELAKKIESARRRFSENLSRLPMCTEILLAEYERARSGEISVTDVIEWLVEGGSESDSSADIIDLADNVCHFPTAIESNSDSGPSVLDEDTSAEILGMEAIGRHMRSLAGLYEEFTLAASRHSYGHAVCENYRSAISKAFMQCALSEKMLSEMLKAVKHLSETAINELETFARLPLSLDVPSGFDEDLPNLTNVVEQTVYPSPFDDTAQEDLGRVMKNAINVLTQFESKIVCCWYGIGTNAELTLQDLGNEHNLSRE